MNGRTLAVLKPSIYTTQYKGHSAMQCVGFSLFMHVQSNVFACVEGGFLLA